VKVEVHLFATLATHVPPGAVGDGVTLDVPGGSTVADVIQVLKIPADVDCLHVVNGRDAASEHHLADGDVLVLFPPLAGGA
jgi:molybdopterin synthase sulfur carrier subunit